MTVRESDSGSGLDVRHCRTPHGQPDPVSLLGGRFLANARSCHGIRRSSARAQSDANARADR